jgi:20S proteasome subunit alpha 2
MGESEYSFSLTTFSPSGKLVQIEYALHAVAAGTTSLGVKARNGVVLATEKKLPSLIDETSIQKISLVADHVGLIYSGMPPDFRVLLRKGRKAARKYFNVYHEPIPIIQLVREIAAVMQEFTQSGYGPW